MMTFVNNELEVASPGVVRQAARDFAEALTMTPEFQQMEAAAAALQRDADARKVIRAFQEKQQALQGLLMLGALSPEEQAAFERLRDAYVNHPTVSAYLQAQEELRTLCQQAGGALSAYIDIDFAAACAGGGCC